jgi:hypothetical protein
MTAKNLYRVTIGDTNNCGIESVALSRQKEEEGEPRRDRQGHERS